MPVVVGVGIVVAVGVGISVGFEVGVAVTVGMGVGLGVVAVDGVGVGEGEGVTVEEGTVLKNGFTEWFLSIVIVSVLPLSLSCGFELSGKIWVVASTSQ